MQIQLGSLAVLFLLTQFVLEYLPVFFIVSVPYSCLFTTATSATYKQAAVYRWCEETTNEVAVWNSGLLSSDLLVSGFLLFGAVVVEKSLNYIDYIGCISERMMMKSLNDMKILSKRKRHPSS